MPTCPLCQSENQSDARFCQHCGQKRASLCAACGTANAPGANFCHQCGNRLATGDTDPVTRLVTLREGAPATLQEKMRAARTRLEGARKPVTILFSDIVGSTALAEGMDPEEWKEVVSGAHRRVSEAVYRFEGTIAQLLGDGVLAFFGAPLTHEDDPVRAVHAALDIQAAMARYRQELAGYVDDFQVRVGIHSGEVVVGEIGDDLHMEYLALGDAVNLAARLQAAALPGGVLISADTARMVKAVFELEDRGELELKGKSEQVAVYEVTGVKALPERGRGIAGLPAPFIGREQELDRLGAALEKLAQHQGQVVLVMGEAGIGKTRLVAEARAAVEAGDPQAQIRWLEGRALSYGGSLSFWTIQQLFLADLELTDGAPAPQVRAALRKRVNELFGPDQDQHLPYLAHLLGLRLEGETAAQLEILDRETLRRQVKSAVTGYFERVAAEQPTVLVLEDLHWADPSSLETLQELLALTNRAGLMVLCQMRVDRDHPSWGLKLHAETDYAHRYTEIHLRRLSTVEADALANRLLEIADFPQAVWEQILSRAEGNPFYLEEILRSLIDQGLVVAEVGTWRARAEINAVTIPATLQGVLLARLDRLEEDVRRTLQLAAVVGKSFLYRLLAAIAEAEGELDAHLAQLQRVDLVREKTRLPELEYMFKHSLTQEAAYNSLLIERRKKFHLRVGEALEGLFAGRREEYYGILAYHFEAAGEVEKAADYLIQTGDKARLEDALAEATGYYQRALPLLDTLADPRRAAQTWLKLGLIHSADFEFEAAHQANEQAFALEREGRWGETATRLEGTDPNVSRALVFNFSIGYFDSLNPVTANDTSQTNILVQLFSGLVRIDAENNVVPEVARSWEVLDKGRRYLFHLRDDVRWTDGTQVTAEDFEWALKYKLKPASESYEAKFGILDDILGARPYRLGQNLDPNSVGIRALDPLTLEIRLETAVAYFINLADFIPLPRKVIEKYGDDWWRPEYIVSNGPFKLMKYDKTGGKMIRNPDYFGNFPGNLSEFIWPYYENREAAFVDFQDNKVDFIQNILSEQAPKNVLPKYVQQGHSHDTVYILIINPSRSPLDDRQVRQALALSLDRTELLKVGGFSTATVAYGGVVPPVVPGHTPELGFRFNVDAARVLLSKAGYPKGRGFPPISISNPWGNRYLRLIEEIARQWQEKLGIEVKPTSRLEADNAAILSGWAPDYLDPDSMLKASNIYASLRDFGWHDARFENLIERAASISNRARRLAKYREADQLLVAEEALLIPICYGWGGINLVQPWVRNLRSNALGFFDLREVILEDRLGEG